MNAFRTLLIVIFTVILGYTAIVGFNHGWNLLPIFFGDIFAMTWAGQFNLDFTCFLILSALWLSWRHNFSTVGIIFGLLGLFGGSLFLSLYLFFASLKAKGDIKELFLGKERL
ncbi:MAG: hypothetical protein HQK72_13990 [Desulfamplus sp.]|nr:hypothetical protein [Desulfamplus sp.]